MNYKAVYNVLNESTNTNRIKYQKKEKVFQDLKKRSAAELALAVIGKMSDSDIDHYYSKI